MRFDRRAAALTIAMVGAGIFAMDRPTEGQTGLSGRVEVKRVEAGFPLGGDALRVRVHLATGQAVEYATRDSAEIERILRLVDTFSEPNRSRLFVELEGNALKSLQLSVPF